MYPYYETEWSILPPEHNRRGNGTFRAAVKGSSDRQQREDDSSLDIEYSPGLTINNIKQVINETIETNILRKPSPTRLRELIRQIRTARTAAEERSVVNTECAYIRSTFRETDCIWKCRNMAKLLYIHMLGYPAHFGQMEALKLATSSKYTDKRIGYLAAMLLLDERHDVHVLLTNCLKNDLNSPTQFIVGTALCTLAAIASPEMARDLTHEIERLAASSNTFLRKKAILCAFRMIRRVPELMEEYMPKCAHFLNDKNHGILVSTITLVTEMCEQSPMVLGGYFKSSIPVLVRMLKTLIVTGYSPEHVVNGVSDPFLQVKILRLLRILGHGDPDQSETMNDVLAQVATNTETNKNAGNAILYETVVTIMNVESENSLRVLAVNILGRFLLNSDKNIRYVGLLTLVRTVQRDMTAVQRHRITILECLSDSDSSIQKCAMELSFTLINTQNIETIVRELLKYLNTADPDMMGTCSSKIVSAAELYSPSIRWHLDVLLKVLTICGNNIRDDVIASTIQLISNSPKEEQSFISEKMWGSITNMNQLENRQPLVQVAVWTLGEYGEAGNFNENELIDHYQQLLWAPQLSITTKQYILVSLAKISVRMEHCTANIQNIINGFRVHLNVDLQQRAVEFNQLFTNFSHLKAALLEKMPVMKISDMSTSEYNSDFAAEQTSGSQSEESTPLKEPSNQDILLDLLGDSFGSSSSTSNTATPSPIQQSSPMGVPAANTNILDLLGLGTIETKTVPVDHAMQSPLEYSATTIPVFSRDNIDIRFIVKKESGHAVVTVKTTNNSLNMLEKYMFQVAVPKAFTIRMLEPSSTVMLPGESIVQDINVVRLNPTVAAHLRMKVRFSYEVGNYSMVEQADVNEFPPDLFD